jgi:hypothetical protein
MAIVILPNNGLNSSQGVFCERHAKQALRSFQTKARNA